MNRKIELKRLILIVIIAMISICIAGISYIYGATVTGTVNTVDGVNVRTEPDTSTNNIIMAIPYKAKVEILGTAQGSGYNWYKIKYNSKTGYAVSDYIDKDSSGGHESGDFTNTYGTVDSNIGVNVRIGPGTEYKIIDGLSDGTQVKVNGIAKDSSGNVWYEVKYSKGKGYVFGEYLILKEVKPYEPNVDFEQHLINQGFPESYKELLRKAYANHNSWVFIADQTGLDWDTVIDKENGYSGKTKFNVVGSWFPSEFIADRIPGETDYGSGWAPASRYAIEYYMDPRNFIDSNSIFQFMSSKYDPSIQNKSGVESIISGSFMVGKSPGYDANGNYYSSYADVIMTAAEKSGVSAYMIASMIINEQSRNGSPASLGTVKGYEGFYNFFNIGATDGGDPNVKGAIYAKGQGWNTPAKSIIGGAVWFGNDYIKNNQYTPYLKKFNVMNGIGNVPYHQYMTNVSGAWQEGNTQASAYLKMGDIPIVFNIPVFKNMPGMDVSDNNYLDSLSVDKGTLSPTFNRNTLTYNVDAGNATSIYINAKASDSSAKVEGIGQKTLKAGTNTFNITVTSTSGEKRVYTVNVKTTAKQLISIELTAKPTKTNYTYGDSKLDLTGLKVTARYSDSSSESISVTQLMATGYDLKKVGTQKVVITYKEKTTSFDIVVSPADISNKTVKLEYTSIKYDSFEKKPKVTVNGLVLDRDYTVTYENNINPGKATVKVKGKGNYTGSITANFEIVKYEGLDQIFDGNEKVRLAGNDRYATAIEVAEAFKKHLGGDKFDSIVVAGGSDYPDALSGSYLANLKKAPILLIDKSVKDEVVSYINNNLKENGMVYIIGGNVAISSNIEQEIHTSNIVRLGGKDRYETNLKVLQYVGVKSDELVICTGNDFADAISVSASGKPLMIVGASMSENQKSFLKNNGYKFTIVGGESAVTARIERELNSLGIVKNRIGGANRYETSVKVAEKLNYNTSNAVILATGQDFPDGLVAGTLGYQSGSPLILVDRNNDRYAKEYGRDEKIERAIVLGGSMLVSDEMADAIVQ